MAQANAPSSALSVSKWQTRRPREPPSAERTANSRSRCIHRAMSRLLTLAHATSSRNPAAAHSIRLAVFTSPNRKARRGIIFNVIVGRKGGTGNRD
jgi:hypothetical protein